MPYILVRSFQLKNVWIYPIKQLNCICPHGKRILFHFHFPVTITVVEKSTYIEKVWGK